MRIRTLVVLPPLQLSQGCPYLYSCPYPCPLPKAWLRWGGDQRHRRGVWLSGKYFVSLARGRGGRSSRVTSP